MKSMKSLALLLAAGLLAMPLSGATFAAEADSVKPFAIGQYTVLPLLDSRGQMKIEIFSGPLSPEARAALMPGGVAPASTNMFLIQGPSGNLLIDTGWGASGPGQNVLPERLKSVGLTMDDIDLVLLTHRHSDHIGGLLKGTAPAFSKAKVLVSAPELAAWQEQTGPAAAMTPDPQAQPVAPGDLPKAVLAAYGDRLQSFELGAPLAAAGLEPISAIGHTAGHTAFLLESEGKKMLFIGDLLHAALLQFPQPDENSSYDNDPAQAAASRRTLLGRAADEKLPIAGAHIPFPGTGLVAKDGQGFAFTPTTEGF